MSSILKDLYYGNLSPADTIIPQDPNYGPLWDKIEQETERLAAKLPPEDGERLENLDDLYGAAACMYACESFASGLRLGMALCRETLTPYDAFDRKT